MKGLQKIVRSMRDLGRGMSRASGLATPHKPVSIGLALGGGFARGIVHVGVLKALEAENIPISFVAGTSVGALIGAAYCSGVTPAELEEIAARVRFRGLDSWNFSRIGFSTNQSLINFLNYIMLVLTFYDLCPALTITVT